MSAAADCAHLPMPPVIVPAPSLLEHGKEPAHIGYENPAELAALTRNQTAPHELAQDIAHCRMMHMQQRGQLTAVKVIDDIPGRAFGALRARNQR